MTLRAPDINENDRRSLLRAKLYAHGVSDKDFEKSDQLVLFSLMYMV